MMVQYPRILTDFEVAVVGQCCIRRVAGGGQGHMGENPEERRERDSEWGFQGTRNYHLLCQASLRLEKLPLGVPG